MPNNWAGGSHPMTCAFPPPLRLLAVSVQGVVDRLPGWFCWVPNNWAGGSHPMTCAFPPPGPIHSRVLLLLCFLFARPLCLLAFPFASFHVPVFFFSIPCSTVGCSPPAGVGARGHQALVPVLSSSLLSTSRVLHSLFLLSSFPFLFFCRWLSFSASLR